MSRLASQTRGPFRLGGQFANWGRPGAYFHAFGPIGARLDAVPFQHYWIKFRQIGEDTRIEPFSTASTAAKMHRFARPTCGLAVSPVILFVRVSLPCRICWLTT